MTRIINRPVFRICSDTVFKEVFTKVPNALINLIDDCLEIDYEKEMARIQTEMKEVMKQEKESQQMLEDAFRGIGYGID